MYVLMWAVVAAVTGNIANSKASQLGALATLQPVFKTLNQGIHRIFGN